MNCPRFAPVKIISKVVLSKINRLINVQLCNYRYTVVLKSTAKPASLKRQALQLYLEGLSYREIERILGVSHVSISNWVKEFKIKKPPHPNYHPTYKIFKHNELVDYLQSKEKLSGAGMIITVLGDKFMLIKWERFKD